MREEDLFAAHGVKDEPPMSSSRLVEQSGDCILWLGARNQDGYPILRSGNSSVSLTRLVFEATVRPLRPGEIVRHVPACPNRHCFAARHLSAIARSQAFERPEGALTTDSARHREFMDRRRDAIARGFPSTDLPPTDPHSGVGMASTVHRLSTAFHARKGHLSTASRSHDDSDEPSLGENDQEKNDEERNVETPIPAREDNRASHS